MIPRSLLLSGVTAGLLGMTACAGLHPAHQHPAPARPPAGHTVREVPARRPAQLDLATRRPTENGAYVVSYESELTPIPLNRLHSWVIKVTRPDGTPVDGAELSVWGDMPEHGHGMPTQPRVVEQLGAGRYRVGGMKFQMPGWWEIEILVRAPQGEDRVRFNLDLVGAPGAPGHVHGGHHHHGVLPPIGVMGSHTHPAGSWMPSYRFMFMEMEGNRDGTDRQGLSEVLGDYMVAPKRMTMRMHMLGLMYGLTDRVTVMAMVPWKIVEMDHRTRMMGNEFTTRAEGLGDIGLSALVGLPGRGPHRWHLNLGLSLPTGSIEEDGDTPMGDNVQLPYPMQLGSGTLDLRPGVTYQASRAAWNWGSQARATLRLGRNNRDYRLGNEYGLTAWLGRQWAPWLNTSLRLDGRTWEDISGEDDALNPRMVPTADPELRGGTRVDALAGLNLIWGGQTFSVEGGVPIYQNLDGPQLETDWLLTLGWQGMF